MTEASKRRRRKVRNIASNARRVEELLKGPLNRNARARIKSYAKHSLTLVFELHPELREGGK
jgi:hypothetical protein